eukprot:Blabericola_migrator_1__7668@NODE_3913_length_1429_cov_5_849486_g2417_i0_p2_GENE_NODE_3913_length_1429_cov_5_849486_g2417_i0NODE_3913_length_1429_cov_5_849486_g2417_i0_p2_ORF_typecomplete_len109_score2_25P_proprotein/PF01483_20/0_0081DUF4051/PF13260_6/0_073DUF4051/PF13260_6/2_9e03_NODE_3913_length_1429_cov_5_849486_g2417_i092418
MDPLERTLLELSRAPALLLVAPTLTFLDSIRSSSFALRRERDSILDKRNKTFLTAAFVSHHVSGTWRVCLTRKHKALMHSSSMKLPSWDIQVGLPYPVTLHSKRTQRC